MSEHKKTAIAVMRSLKHLEYPRNAMGVKNASRMPRPFKDLARWVPIRDRVIFWNIAPGDYVRQRSGKYFSRLSVPGSASPSRSELRVRGEGVVDQVDRTHNKVFLRVEDDDENPRLNKLAPALKRQLTSRQVETNGEKSFTPNFTKIARAIHYSNLEVRIPNEVLPEEVVKAAAGQPIYARAITKRHLGYDRRGGHFAWERIAAYRHPVTKQKHKIKLPWPKRERKARDFKKFTTGRNDVLEESWVPWDARDPVFSLPEMLTTTGRVWSTPESEVGAARARIFWEAYKNAIRRASRVNAAHPKNADAYIGYKKDANWARRLMAKPPPSAQPPLPAEKVNLRNKLLAAWAAEPERKDHIEVEGGRAFAAQDYLRLAPVYGPFSDKHWAGFDEREAWTSLAEARHLPTGTLLQRPSKAQIDAYPIEVLMHRELTQRPVLHAAHRQRRGHKLMRQEQAELAEAEAEAEADEDEYAAAAEEDEFDADDAHDGEWVDEEDTMPRTRTGKLIPKFTPEEQRMNSLRNLRL